MAIIKCPECGSDVSDRALSCPKCGYPLDAEKIMEKKAVNEKEWVPQEGKGSTDLIYTLDGKAINMSELWRKYQKKISV